MPIVDSATMYFCVLLVIITHANAYLRVKTDWAPKKFCNELIFDGFNDAQKSECPYVLRTSWRKKDRLRVTVTGRRAQQLTGVVCQMKYRGLSLSRFVKQKRKHVNLTDCRILHVSTRSTREKVRLLYFSELMKNGTVNTD